MERFQNPLSVDTMWTLREMIYTVTPPLRGFNATAFCR